MKTLILQLLMILGFYLFIIVNLLPYLTSFQFNSKNIICYANCLSNIISNSAGAAAQGGGGGGGQQNILPCFSGDGLDCCGQGAGGQQNNK